MNISDEKITLKVQDAHLNDIGSGRARIDTKTRMALGTSPGEYLEVIGRRASGVVVWRVFQNDEGKGLIRMDRYIQKNFEVSIGDAVQVRKIKCQTAEKITLTPILTESRKAPIEPFKERFTIDLIKYRPMKAGDSIFIKISPDSELGYTFKVKGTVPEGIVIIEDATIIYVENSNGNGRLDQWY